MGYILIQEKAFEETSFENEQELEDAVVRNKKYIFGKDTVLINYKRKTGAKESRNTGIPDGFLIDFTAPNKPQLFFVEYELESHDLYEHIGPQIMKFYASFETAKRELHKKLMDIIKSDIRKFNCEVQHLGGQEGICYPKWPCQNTMFTLPKRSVSL